ncbi:50S ribosomal protein L15 [Candidatus Chlorohelix sp.]|uniref:50S ribosomal protein L15 n=1 Tax=Candidatus Chlorohelix sp. TaxID=3139201 RepID=UPI00302EBB1D
MQQHDLKPAPGSTSAPKRVGRGHGSGLVKTSGFGQKGQKARTGHHKVPVWFEGAPSKVNTFKRTGYKRGTGFNNPNRVEYEVVNLSQLEDWEGGEVTVETLIARRFIRTNKPVKVLGRGEISKALTVRVHRLSESAKQKITAAGGNYEELTPAESGEEDAD